MIRKVIKAIRDEDCAQALVELSISLPLLLLLLLGAVELGRVAYASIEVTNAAKAAAAYGAMNGGAFSPGFSSNLDETGMLRAATADAADLSSVSFTSGYPQMACSCSGSGSATCGAPPTGCSPPLSKVVVTVTVQTQTTFDPLIYIPGWAHGPITLKGWAQQKVLPL
jgi:hypothetical protein